MDTMENKVPTKIHAVVKWDPEVAKSRDWKDTLGRYGGPNRVMDFHEVNEWTNITRAHASKI